MNAIVTVFKKEFEGKDHLIATASLIAETKDIDEAVVFIAKPGKLFELLHLLRNNQINYGTHYNTVE